MSEVDEVIERLSPEGLRIANEICIKTRGESFPKLLASWPAEVAWLKNGEDPLLEDYLGMILLRDTISQIEHAIDPVDQTIISVFLEPIDNDLRMNTEDDGGVAMSSIYRNPGSAWYWRATPTRLLGRSATDAQQPDAPQS